MVTISHLCAANPKVQEFMQSIVFVFVTMVIDRVPCEWMMQAIQFAKSVGVGAAAAAVARLSVGEASELTGM